MASSTGSFENILKSETEDLQDITEDAVKNLQEMWSQTLKIHKELQEQGNTFLQKSSTVNFLCTNFTLLTCILLLELKKNI